MLHQLLGVRHRAVPAPPLLRAPADWPGLMPFCNLGKVWWAFQPEHALFTERKHSCFPWFATCHRPQQLLPFLKSTIAS